MSRPKKKRRIVSIIPSYAWCGEPIPDDWHYLITITKDNNETIINDFPAYLKETAIRRYCWLGRHTKAENGVISLWRGYQTEDQKIDKISKQIHLYDKWLISQGLGVNPKTL